MYHAHGVETLPKISIAWVWCTNVTDDRQTTDGRTMTYSEREREFTFSKNWCCNADRSSNAAENVSFTAFYGFIFGVAAAVITTSSCTVRKAFCLSVQRRQASTFFTQSHWLLQNRKLRHVQGEPENQTILKVVTRHDCSKTLALYKSRTYLLTYMTTQEDEPYQQCYPDVAQ